MRTIPVAGAALAVFAAMVTIGAQAPGPPGPRAGEPAEAVPVHREPHHRQLFQHGAVRILDMQLPPGDMSWFHVHDHPVLLLALTSSQTRTQVLGGEWSGGAAGRGGAAAPTAPAAPAPSAAGPRAIRPSSTTTYADKPVTHRLENIGTGVARNIVVVNESAGNESLTEQQAGFSAKPELSNKWFRAYRITLSPGERSAAHKHGAAVAIIQVTAGKAAGVGAMTWEFNEPGQWGFFEPGDPHVFLNSGNERVELIEVEIRK